MACFTKIQQRNGTDCYFEKYATLLCQIQETRAIAIPSVQNMYVIKARTHGGVRNDSETHSTGVTGLHSRRIQQHSLVRFTVISHPPPPTPTPHPHPHPHPPQPPPTPHPTPTQPPQPPTPIPPPHPTPPHPLNCVHYFYIIRGNTNFEESIHIVLFGFLQSHNIYVLHMNIENLKNMAMEKGSNT